MRKKAISPCSLKHLSFDALAIQKVKKKQIDVSGFVGWTDSVESVQIKRPDNEGNELSSPDKYRKRGSCKNNI